jgi:hypothetical protein
MAVREAANAKRLLEPEARACVGVGRATHLDRAVAVEGAVCSAQHHTWPRDRRLVVQARHSPRGNDKHYPGPLLNLGDVDTPLKSHLLLPIVVLSQSPAIPKPLEVLADGPLKPCAFLELLVELGDEAGYLFVEGFVVDFELFGADVAAGGEHELMRGDLIGRNALA